MARATPSQLAYMRAKTAERLREARDRLGDKCSKCGSTDRLEFDHIDPATKVRPLMRLALAKPSKWEAELAKCQVLCHECHWDKTRQDRSLVKGGTHGTRNTYNHGCRCDLCRASGRDHMRDLRARWRAEGRTDAPLYRVIPPEKHGLSSTYTNLRCRCDQCRRANRDQMRSYKARRRGDL